jgi:hypothetical protein
MKFNDKNVTGFLYALQGVGAFFVAFFLAAYLAGLPTTIVYHSEPVFRFPLIIFGIIFLGMIIIGIVIAALRKAS